MSLERPQLLQLLGRRHLEDGGDLLWLDLDAAMSNDKAEEDA